MNILASLPLIGKVLEKIVDRFWPDKKSQHEKTLEIELETARQSGGRVTPRMLLQYIVACGVALYISLSVVEYFFPEFGSPPEWLKEVFSLAGMLFGFGG